MAGSRHGGSQPPAVQADHAGGRCCAWQAGEIVRLKANHASVCVLQANVPTAMESAVREMASTDPPGVVCVCGSLHAVAAALQSSFCTSSI